MSDKFIDHVRAVVSENFDGNLPKEVDRYLADSLSWSEIRCTQVLNWISDLRRTCDDLDASADPSYIPDTAAVFLIRLWGLFAEAKPFFAPKIVLSESIYRQSLALQKHRDVHSAIETLESQLTAEETLTIEYLRHRQCHIHQDGYRIRIRGSIQTGYQLVEKRGKLDVDALLGIVKVVLKPYGMNERFLAKALAERVRLHATALDLAAKAWRAL